MGSSSGLIVISGLASGRSRSSLYSLIRPLRNPFYWWIRCAT